jgi:hypothetical protein
MEDQANYVTETEEALTMLGVGYDKAQPSVILQPKRKGIALMDSGLEEYDVWGWVKVSANFINHIGLFSGANLKCWLVIALAIDESGKCKLTIKQLQLLTKLSHTEVINSTKELEAAGYLQVKRGARGNEYTPIFAARGIGNDPETVVKKVESTLVDSVESTPSLEELHPSINRVKRVNTPQPIKKDAVDWAIDFERKPAGIRKAFADYFKLTPNWEAKYNRQFLEWSVEQNITPEQIKAAAELWRVDKRFNWSVPTLKGIQEHWLELTQGAQKPPRRGDVHAL